MSTVDTDAEIEVLREGDTSKDDPFTICLIANPALESPRFSGSFEADPILTMKSDFDACAEYTVDCLFGDVPGQGERLLGHPDIQDAVRIVALFDPDLAPGDANSLVAEDDPSRSRQIIARRTAFRPFLARYKLDADVAFAITASSSHNHATAFDTSDDNGRAGVAFVLDGVTYYHRYYSLIPGTVALHVTDRDLTPLHEFQHALGSYTNGQVIDLYDPDDRGINKKQGRPIPAHFAAYDGVDYSSDPSRDGIGYGSRWRSYHCELHFPSAPALMDNYYQAPAALGLLACENDKITRQFLLDRLRAKINR